MPEPDKDRERMMMALAWQQGRDSAPLAEAKNPFSEGDYHPMRPFTDLLKARGLVEGLTESEHDFHARVGASILSEVEYEQHGTGQPPIPEGWTQGGETYTPETHPELFAVIRAALSQGHAGKKFDLPPYVTTPDPFGRKVRVIVGERGEPLATQNPVSSHLRTMAETVTRELPGVASQYRTAADEIDRLHAGWKDAQDTLTELYASPKGEAWLERVNRALVSYDRDDIDVRGVANALWDAAGAPQRADIDLRVVLESLDAERAVYGPEKGPQIHIDREAYDRFRRPAALSARIIVESKA